MNPAESCSRHLTGDPERPFLAGGGGQGQWVLAPVIQGNLMGRRCVNEVHGTCPDLHLGQFLLQAEDAFQIFAGSGEDTFGIFTRSGERCRIFFLLL